MNYSKKDIKIAKKILEASTFGENIEESKLFSNITIIKKMKPNKALNILQALLKEVISFKKKRTLMLESAEILNASHLSEVKRIFERKIGRPLNIDFRENKALVGGIKIKLEDTVWDYSVHQSLEVFKERING